ncbi:MAG: tetratricopeptide repeat protein [Verrucomicrobiales bacterium]|nr:tetratricopeptide repeat protein [Verrucomicrobiales bacterium]
MSGGIDQYMRGELLMQQGRYEDAAAFLKQAIAANPENDLAFADLSMCLLEMEGRRKDALAAMDEAIALDPEYGRYRAMRALVLCRLDRGKDALVAAQEAIGMEPEDAFAYAAKAQAHLSMEHWAEGEVAAKESLALDGDNQFAGNLLAMSLRLQGKAAENDLAVEQLLAENPEDSLAHYNAGWSALQKNDQQKAEEHFKEALRIDPSFDGAREGLKESFAARSAFYRKYLQYCFFMQRFTEKARWAIVIGFYLAYRFGMAVLSKINPVLAIAFAALYLTFALWGWLAPGLGHFLILLDRSARHALTKSEKLDGLAVGGGLLLGIGVAIIGASWAITPLMVVGGVLCAGTLPATLFLTNESKRGRWVFGSIMAYVYVVGMGVALAEWWRGAGELADGSVTLLVVGAVLTLLCTWIGSISALHRAEVE